jgi:hypothetical protein
MKKTALMVLALTGALALSLLSNSNIRYASAHETKKFGNINIEFGWANEPALAGQMNTAILEITTASDGKPVANAVEQLQATIKKGGDTKALDLLPQEEEGVYGAQVIPSQIGEYQLVLKGTVSGQAVDGTVNLDTVEDSKEFNFPAGGSTNDQISSGVIDQFKTALTDLTTQVGEAKASADQAQNAAQSAQAIKASADQAYMFGAIGIGIGVAGIALAVIALSKREKVEGKAPRF